MWELWPVLVIGAILAYMMLRVRETFVIRYGNPFDNEDIISFDPNERKGTRLFSTYPHTCPENRLDLQDGLCYEECSEGYNGVGPMCHAETQNIGVGTLARVSTCREMGLDDSYEESPLLCWKHLKCETGSGWNFFRFDQWKCSGPDVKSRSLSCPGNQDAFFSIFTSIATGSFKKPKLEEYTDLTERMCYKPCPTEKPNRVPGMPYLCYRARDGNTGVSYGRGVGTVPPLFHFGA